MQGHYKLILALGAIGLAFAGGYIASRGPDAVTPPGPTSETTNDAAQPGGAGTDPARTALRDEPSTETTVPSEAPRRTDTWSIPAPQDPPAAVAARDRDTPAWGLRVEPSDPAAPTTPADEVESPADADPALSEAPDEVIEPLTAPPVEVATARVETPAPAPVTATRPADSDPVSAPAEAAARTHAIQSGDTFSALAVRYYGHAKYADHIARANPDLDPRRLFVGAKVNLPVIAGVELRPANAPTAAATPPSGAAPAGTSTAASPTAAAADASPPGTAAPETPAPSRPDRAADRSEPAAQSYVVKAGDSWYELARRFLGDGNNWPQLYEFNRENDTRDLRRLYPGMVIKLPGEARLADSAAAGMGDIR